MSSKRREVIAIALHLLVLASVICAVQRGIYYGTCKAGLSYCYGIEK